jgi:competence protein ComEA
LLVDGEQVLVGLSSDAGAAVPPSPGATGSGAAPGPGVPVNLNTATEPELEALPEVGPVTAQSILTWRDQHGRFSSVDELLEVDGIGDATLAKLTPYVTV